MLVVRDTAQSLKAAVVLPVDATLVSLATDDCKSCPLCSSACEQVSVKFSADPDESPTSTGGKDDEREWTPDSDDDILRAAGMR